MAIVNNLWLRGSKKRLAGTVIYQSNGQTIQRELASSVSNPRTESQMQQRVRWANLVAFYRAAKPMMRYAFEAKKATQSDYNALMSANVSNSPVYLTKAQANSGACVVAPYIITKGSLPSISISPKANDWESDIYLGDLDDFADISVRDLALAILANNPGVHEGDQLSFVRFTQSVNPATGNPYVILRKYEVLMDVRNNDLLVNYLPTDIVFPVGSGSSFRVGVLNNGGTGAFALILSRTIGGKTYVSTQNLTLVNMASVLAQYTNADQLAVAIQSYGETEDAFLSSTTANYGQGGEIVPTIMYIKVGDNTFSAGDVLPTAGSINGKRVEIAFNKALSGGYNGAWFDTRNASSVSQTASLVNDRIVIASAVTDGLPADAYIADARVKIGDTVYRVTFDDLPSGGLE